MLSQETPGIVTYYAVKICAINMSAALKFYNILIR